MRLRACIGGLLLASAACAQLPERVRIDVDGRTVEVRQQGVWGLFEEDLWSASSSCEAGTPRIKLDEIGATIVVIRPDVLEVTLANGKVRKLHRCPR